MDAIHAELQEMVLYSLPAPKIDWVPARFVCKLWYNIIKRNTLCVNHVHPKHYSECVTDIANLLWAGRNGCKVTTNAMNLYASHGRLDMIKLAFRIGIEDFELGTMLHNAAKGNHMNVVLWVMEKKPLNSDLCPIVRHCSVEMFDTISYRFNECKTYVVYEAVEGDNVSVLQRLNSRDYGGILEVNREELLEIAIDNNCTKAYAWLHKNLGGNKWNCLDFLTSPTITHEQLDNVEDVIMLNMENRDSKRRFKKIVNIMILRELMNSLSWLLKKNNDQVTRLINACVRELLQDKNKANTERATIERIGTWLKDRDAACYEKWN